MKRQMMTAVAVCALAFTAGVHERARDANHRRQWLHGIMRCRYEYVCMCNYYRLTSSRCCSMTPTAARQIRRRVTPPVSPCESTGTVSNSVT